MTDQHVSKPLSWRVIGCLVAAGFVVVGSMGPWAKVLVFSKAGTEGDGMITLVFGAIAGVIAIVGLSRRVLGRGSALAMAGCFGLAALIGIVTGRTFRE